MKKWLKRPRKTVITAAFVALLLLAEPAVHALSSWTNPFGSPGVGNGITLHEMDLHDGTIQKFGNTYYMYGTMYGCGYNWGQHNTPWCGFGVSTASNLNGPWSAPQQLFSPSDWDSFAGMNWSTECGSTGAGCFNPRMVQRTWGPKDGVYMLWFNAPADFNRNGSNAYYVMGCNGPAGRCGANAGAPYGSTRKPPLYICGGNGDFTIVTNGSANPYIVCTNADQTLSEEQLDYWGTTGLNTGGRVLGNLHSVESPGVYRDPATGTWIMTYSDVNCGYCGGTGTGFATASSPAGPWYVPGDAGAAAPVTGRRDISATSCGGQPRTVFSVDGQAWEWIDTWGIWNGNWTNQTHASVLIVPLTYRPSNHGTGNPMSPQFVQWPCS